MADNGKEQYLEMQRTQYEREAGWWSLSARDHVVGSYDAHNQWTDYETLLFKDHFDTPEMVALEYGCGPGRNLIRFAKRFKRIDGVDLAQNNLNGAMANLHHNNLPVPNLYHNDGSTLPMISDETYDVVFSVICIQHIASYDVRFSILNEIHRVLKTGGKFCFQIGFGGKPPPYTCAPYFENAFDAKMTNGGHDVEVINENQLRGDLVDKIGFKNYRSDIAATGPGDRHRQWIWVQVEK